MSVQVADKVSTPPIRKNESASKTGVLDSTSQPKQVVSPVTVGPGTPVAIKPDAVTAIGQSPLPPTRNAKPTIHIQQYYATEFLFNGGAVAQSIQREMSGRSFILTVLSTAAANQRINLFLNDNPTPIPFLAIAGRSYGINNFEFYKVRMDVINDALISFVAFDSDCEVWAGS